MFLFVIDQTKDFDFNFVERILGQLDFENQFGQ
jgi:hypothetical protein